MLRKCESNARTHNGYGRIHVGFAALVVIAISTIAQAHEGHGPSPAPRTKTTSSSSSGGRSMSAYDLHLDQKPLRPQHGGQVTVTRWHYFEVVYTPQEARIYIYSPSQKPIWGTDVRGDVTMQVNGNPQLFRFPVKEAKDAQGMVYLCVHADVSRVRDGDMQVTFDLTNLPRKEERQVRFTQTFSLTGRSSLEVAVAQIMEADRPLVERQRVCPVMDAALGEHGTPIKLLVGDQTLFVCCQGCVDEVRKSPRVYLDKAAAATPDRGQTPPMPVVSANYATQADDPAIRAQSTCPVMDQPLGGHGAPIKVLIDGRPIFVCCKGCIEKVARDPGPYFEKLAKIAPTNRQGPPQRQVVATWAAEADRANVQAQAVCPVMDQPLGDHGTPIKMQINDRSVFVCCQGCVRKVEQNPDYYLQKVAQARRSP